MSTPTGSASIPDLGTRSTRNGVVGALGAWGRFAVQFATVVTVARMLGPEQYGMAATVLIFTTLAEFLRTSGIVNAVIQRDDLTPERTATVHLVSSVIGASVAVCAASVYLALGGGIDLALGFALIIAATGVSAIPSALLTRELRTFPLVAGELVAALLSCALAVALASTGAGGASLVWQSAAYATLTAVFVLIAGRRPRAVRAPLREVRAYLRFGGHSAVTQGSRFAAQNSDRMLLTITTTGAEAGLYVQASQLVALPIAQVTGPLHRVVLPAMSRLTADTRAFRACFRAAASVISLTLLPVFAALGVVAEPLILTLFGPEWSGSVALFRVLVVNGIGAALIFLSSWVFVATGRARTQSRITLATAAVTVAAVCAGALFGSAGIAVGLAAATTASVIPTFVIARRGTGLRLGDLIRPLGPGAAVAAIVAAAAWTATVLSPGPSYVTLLSGGGAAASAYLLGVAAVPSARRRVRTLISHTRSRHAGSRTRTEADA
ncbi:oligosaccharide flippase family protein [Microbacterium sp. NPDC057407]|uniref:oligosaccharide flippase family protein n=1 Tax=Microbacterium sp. NPDC057407 TaxID=3346120 RepID=UPI00366D2483